MKEKKRVPFGMSHKFCRKNCRHLFPKEKDQVKGQVHVCYKFKERLYHLGCPPNVLRLKKCDL